MNKYKFTSFQLDIAQLYNLTYNLIVNTLQIDIANIAKVVTIYYIPSRIVYLNKNIL